MSSDKPTAEIGIGPENSSQQNQDQDKPTVMAGQEASQTPTTVDAKDGAFRPTSPPQYPTPPSPTPFRPAAPVSTPPDPSPPGGATMIMETETEPVPLAWLAVLEGVGGRSGVVYQLKQETVIGRTAGDLVLNEDPAVSGEHVKIKLEMNDEEKQFFALYDLASSNGTYVGDRETYQDDENRVYRHVLEDGDFILIGQTTLVFKQV